jgi:hypothetical protein
MTKTFTTWQTSFVKASRMFSTSLVCDNTNVVPSIRHGRQQIAKVETRLVLLLMYKEIILASLSAAFDLPVASAIAAFMALKEF